jgi:hypothetical protein
MNMSGKWQYPEDMTSRWAGTIRSVALLCIAVSTPVLSQTNDGASGQMLTTAVEDHQRFEAERMRQERLQLEAERRRQEKIRFEIERLRQENERHKQEQLILENERLRQENERREQEQLRLEIETRERERAEVVAYRKQPERNDTSSDRDIYEQLETLGQLRADGILTEEEFQRLKRKILD